MNPRVISPNPLSRRFRCACPVDLPLSPRPEPDHRMQVKGCVFLDVYLAVPRYRFSELRGRHRVCQAEDRVLETQGVQPPIGFQPMPVPAGFISHVRWQLVYYPRGAESTSSGTPIPPRPPAPKIEYSKLRVVSSHPASNGRPALPTLPSIVSKTGFEPVASRHLKASGLPIAYSDL